MSKVLVVLEIANGKVRTHCLHGITAAQQIAKARGLELHLLMLGADTSAAAEIAAAGYSATTVHTITDAKLEPFTAEAWADAIVHAIKTINPAVGGPSRISFHSSGVKSALPVNSRSFLWRPILAYGSSRRCLCLPRVGGAERTTPGGRHGK